MLSDPVSLVLLFDEQLHYKSSEKNKGQKEFNHLAVNLVLRGRLS